MSRPTLAPLLLPMLLLGTPCAPAAPLELPPDLPAPIAACLDTATCAVTPAPAFSTAGFAALPYVDADGPGYLLRYALWPSSVARDVAADVRERPLEGALWLQVRERYAAADASPRVGLYLHGVVPDAEPLARWGGGEPFPYTLHFGLSDAALVDGGAERSWRLDDGGASGALEPAEPLLPCLADGCGVLQRLNLVYLDFVAEGDGLRLAFDAHDPRALLYLERSYYTGEEPYDSLRAFYVQTPLPAALGPFALGLAVLARRRRHARRRRAFAWYALPC